MGVVLKKLRIRRVLSRKIENLHRKNVQDCRKQLKLIKQRSKRKYLLLLLLYFTCFGSILNIIRRFVSNKVLREQLKPRNDVYTWRHADHVPILQGDPLCTLEVVHRHGATSDFLIR